MWLSFTFKIKNIVRKITFLLKFNIQEFRETNIYRIQTKEKLLVIAVEQDMVFDAITAMYRYFPDIPIIGLPVRFLYVQRNQPLFRKNSSSFSKFYKMSNLIIVTQQMMTVPTCLRIHSVALN